MSKAVYSWDKDNHFDTIKLVEDDYQLASNETFVKPEDGLYEPITWNGSTWVGTAKEDWEAAHPATPAEPSEGNQALNLLGQQIAKMQQQQTTLMQSVNELGQMVAKATASSAAQPAGSQSAAPAQSAASAQTSAQAQA